MIQIPNSIAFGQIIKEERKRQGFTQAEFAGLCGVGITFLSQLENGKALNVLTMLSIDLYAERRA